MSQRASRGRRHELAGRDEHDHRPPQHAPAVAGRTAGAGTGHLGTGRGHRTLVITRNGGKVVTIPLAPRTARAIGLAIGERTEGPLFLAGDGRR
ncbi:MAG TPA: hypothetical protein VI365_32335, partial [Trebonia sp.]